jgi:hypothetical protein
MLYSLLCGPILRRTDPTRVCIWFATSIVPVGLDVRVFPFSRTVSKSLEAGPQFLTVTTPHVHQLGARLFVILLEVRPAAGKFAPLVPYGYDVQFKFREEDKVLRNSKDVDSRKGGPKEFWFSKEYNIGGEFSYAKMPLPAFVIADPAMASARILYGSCRKVHGPGSDSLNAADKLLAEHWANYLTSRNSRMPDFSLFMLGDQIYADDTIEEVFLAMQAMAGLLMGYDETIPEYANANWMIPDLDDKDLIFFLQRYEAGDEKYKIEDLSLPTKVAYWNSRVPADRRRNVALFLSTYLDIESLSERFVEALLTRKTSIAEISATMGRAVHKLRLPRIDLNEILPREYLRASYIQTQLTKVKDIPFKDNRTPSRSRRSFVRRNSSISTVDEGHALSFGEFAALYLINWGAFPVVTPGSDAWINLQHLGYKMGTTFHDDHKYNLEGVFERNRLVARVFANVPTYMIFDDHEITDEWNYDDVWRDAVEKRSVTGRRMVANGLAAFWAFQAWGNDPSAFSSSFIASIKEHLLAPLTSGAEKPEKVTTFQDVVLGFQDWAFVTPTNPPGVFLDNRTLRGSEEPMDYYAELNENRKFRAVRLMSQVAFDKIAARLVDAKYKPNTPIIFCAPTPIIGAKLFELGQLHMVDQTFNTETLVAGMLPRAPGRHDNDFESWSSNPRGKYEFFNFLDTVVRPSKVAILSGDVHYAFHATGVLRSASGRYYDIEQFTSSALKNNTLDKIDKINMLAYLSLQDTKKPEYKKTTEVYPVPKAQFASGGPVPHFYLDAHLVRYSHLIDRDTWLIFTNNLGLLNVVDNNTSISFVNYFLHSPTFDSPIVKAFSLGIR